MNIGAMLKKGADERGSYIGQATRLGGEVIGHIAHTGRQVGDFRRNNQNTRENRLIQLFSRC